MASVQTGMNGCWRFHAGTSMSSRRRDKRKWRGGTAWETEHLHTKAAHVLFERARPAPLQGSRQSAVLGHEGLVEVLRTVGGVGGCVSWRVRTCRSSAGNANSSRALTPTTHVRLKRLPARHSVNGVGGRDPCLPGRASQSQRSSPRAARWWCCRGRHPQASELGSCAVAPANRVMWQSQLRTYSCEAKQPAHRRWKVPSSWPKPEPGTVTMPVASSSCRQ